MTLALPIPAAAAEIGVSPKTLRREIAQGRLAVVRVRSRVLVLRTDLTTYLETHRRCQSAATAPGGKPAFKLLASDLADLLDLGKTRSSGSGASARSSTIIALDAHRKRASKTR